MAAQKIGVILHDFSTGGSERIAIRLANAWAEAGRRVTLYCGTQSGALRGLVGDGVSVCCCDPPIERSIVSRFRFGLRLAALLRADQPDVIFSPGNYHLLIVALLSRLRFAKRPIFICKLSNPVRSQSSAHPLSAVGEMIMRWACARVDAFTAMSPALRRQARAVFTRQPIFDLAEPILDDELPPLPVDARTEESMRIVCAGRLAPQKNFALALESFARIDRAVNAQLVIYGEGPLLSELSALAHRLEIAERVHFAGYVRDIRPHLIGARLFLMTSRFEGYPAVLIEALAAGVPIVTTNCSPAIAEIVNSPILGLVATSVDPCHIASLIEARLASGPVDQMPLVASTQRHLMKTASQAYLECFDALTRAASAG